MKKSFLAVTGATALCALSLTTAATATAAAAHTAATSSSKPVITKAAGAIADYHTYTDENGVDFQAGLSETTERGGAFTVNVPAAVTRTERVMVREVGGRDLCESRAGLPADDGRSTLFTCSASIPLDFGDTMVEAVLTSSAGQVKSDVVEVQALLPDPSITFDSYDAATRTGHLTLGGLPGADYVVYAGDDVFTGSVPTSGKWNIDVTDADRGTWYSISETYRHIGSSARVWVENTDPVAAPQVESVTAEGVRVRLVVSATGDSLVQVKNARGMLVASASSTGERTEIEFQGPPDVEAHYTVSARAHDVDSVEIPFVANLGKGKATPDAPVVEKVDVSGSKPVVILTGAPGAVVTVLDESGKKVAVKLVDASAHAVLSLPATHARDGSATAYEVRQSSSTANSPITRLVIPGV